MRRAARTELGWGIWVADIATEIPHPTAARPSEQVFQADRRGALERGYLADREQHGLAITKEVFERTDGQMRLWPGMLYGALRKMTDQGLVDVDRRAWADAVASHV